MKVIAKRVVDRLALPAYRTKYKGEGFCLGAQVRVHCEIGRFTAQVWAAGPSRHQASWWVVDATGHAWLMHESDMTIVGQARNDQDALAA